MYTQIFTDISYKLLSIHPSFRRIFTMAKVLALSFGRKMSNTDVMLKEVLKKCEEAGHEIKFIRPDDL